MEYLHILKDQNINRIWGVIGPSGSIEAAENILSLTANSGVITVRERELFLISNREI